MMRYFGYSRKTVQNIGQRNDSSNESEESYSSGQKKKKKIRKGKGTNSLFKSLKNNQFLSIDLSIVRPLVL